MVQSPWAFGEDGVPEAKGFREVVAFFSEGGEVAEGEGAEDAGDDAEKLAGGPRPSRRREAVSALAGSPWERQGRALGMLRPMGFASTAAAIRRIVMHPIERLTRMIEKI
jgi:hypothetical protein